MLITGIILFVILFYSYMFGMVYDNGFESRHRKFRVKSTYYEDNKTKTENHRVQWKLLFIWHNYIVDAHYMDYADFETKEEAIAFIDRKINYKLRKDITYYERQ